MSDVGELGPVEIVIIGLPGTGFDEAIADAIADVVSAGTVSILDLVIVVKEEDGTVTVVELSDLAADEVAVFDRIDGDVGSLLSDEDLEQAGELLPPGSRAALIVWENTWARRTVGAIRAAGGVLLAHDRIDAATVAAAVAEAPD